MEVDEMYIEKLIEKVSEKAAEKAIRNYRIEIKELNRFMTKAECYRLYGRGLTDRILNEMPFLMKKDGNDSARIRIDRIEFENRLNKSIRHSYKPLKERRPILTKALDQKELKHT